LFDDHYLYYFEGLFILAEDNLCPDGNINFLTLKRLFYFIIWASGYIDQPFTS